MNTLRMVAMAAAGILLTGTIATADEVIIIHRSGKIQTVQIDDNADPVDQVSFRKTEKPVLPAGSDQPVVPQVKNTPVAPLAVTTTPTQPASALAPPVAAIAAKPVEAVKPSDKSGVKIKWAEPVDAKY